MTDQGPHFEYPQTPPPLPNGEAASKPPAEGSGAPEKRKLPVKALIVAGGVLVVAGLAAAIFIPMLQPTRLEAVAETCSGTKPVERLGGGNETPEPKETVDGLAESLAEYFDGVVSVEDAGKTLIVSTKSDDDDPIGVSTLALTCVEEELGMPKRVTESIAQTRSLDGRVSDEWDGFAAEWNYHPDNGLNLIIAQK